MSNRKISKGKRRKDKFPVTSLFDIFLSTSFFSAFSTNPINYQNYYKVRFIRFNCHLVVKYSSGYDNQSVFLKIVFGYESTVSDHYKTFTPNLIDSEVSKPKILTNSGVDACLYIEDTNIWQKIVLCSIYKVKFLPAY
jgi:hypothetical protein